MFQFIHEYSKMRVDSLFHSIFPVFFFCLLIGISTICPWRKDGKWYLSESLTFKLIHFFWFYIITISMVTSLVLYESHETYYGGLAGFGVKLVKWTFIGQIYLNFIFTGATSGQFKSTLEDIIFVDKMMEENNVNLHHTKHFWSQILGVSSGFIYLLLLIYIGHIAGNIEKVSTLPSTLFGVFYAACMLAIYGYRFCMMMTILLTRYWAINKELNKLSE